MQTQMSESAHLHELSYQNDSLKFDVLKLHALLQCVWLCYATICRKK